jgi:hypothetical protein
MFPAPISRQPNTQVQQSQVQAYAWTFDHSTDTVIHGSPERFHQFLHTGGFSDGGVDGYISGGTTADFLSAVNDNNASGEYYEGLYVIEPYIPRYYPELHPNYKSSWRYGPLTLQKVNNDGEYNRIYSNAETYIYSN